MMVVIECISLSIIISIHSKPPLVPFFFAF